MSVPIRMTMSLEGEVIIDRVLAGLEERITNLAPAWPAVVAAFQAITARAFSTEGASTGAPWPQLAKRTQADRVRLGFGAAHPILQRTGRLQRALTLGVGAHVSMRPQSMTYHLEAGVGYFVYHQSNKPRKTLPRRAPVLLTADDRTQLLHPVRLYLTGRDLNGPRRGAPRL